MDASSDIGKMISALKHELKARGLRNTDVATHLEVSDTTVKRYFRGQGITLAVLQKLAQMVDLDFFSLVALAGQQSIPKPRLTTTQQDALGRSAVCRAVFFQLMRGMTPSAVGQELGLTPQKMDMQLAKLQGLRLIRRLSNNSVEVLAYPLFEFDAKDPGAITNLARDLARQFLSGLNLRDEDSEWYYTASRLSQASVRRVRELTKRLISEVRKLGRADAVLTSRESQMYEFFIAAQPAKADRFLRPD